MASFFRYQIFLHKIKLFENEKKFCNLRRQIKKKVIYIYIYIIYINKEYIITIKNKENLVRLVRGLVYNYERIYFYILILKNLCEIESNVSCGCPLIIVVE